MYFASRLQAGRMLARQLSKKYHHETCVVVALNDGGVMVGAQIAKELHCPITLLLSSEINLPREPAAIAGITQSGALAFNHAYSAGELSELKGEYFNLIEQEKLEGIHALNKAPGDKGVMDKKLLKNRNVILVADGLEGGFLIDLAQEFLKPISIKKLIIATPFASVPAVDKMHVAADDIYCLNVVADYINTDHYYDQQDVPSHGAVVKTINKVLMHWK